MAGHVVAYRQDASAPFILVADDHSGVRSKLRDGLERDGYAVTEARSRLEIAEYLDRVPVGLITLDIKLGGEDGLALVQDIRARRDVPIVMITDEIGHTHRIECLERGADDHLTKPFLIREVRARVRNLLRRCGNAPLDAITAANGERKGQLYEFEGLTLDAERRELRRHSGEVIQLTEAEFGLLLLFVQRPADVLSRDELMSALRGRTWSPLDRTIDVLVARLRKYIEMSHLIKSVRGIGYVFTGEVKKL